LTFSKKQLTTIAIHVLIWVAITFLPMLFKPSEVSFNSHQLQGIYLNLAITILVFYTSYSVIIPLYFYKKKIVITLALLLLVSVAGSLGLGYTRTSRSEKRLQKLEMHENAKMLPKQYKKMRTRRPLFDNLFFFLLVSGAALSIRATQKWMQEEGDRKSIEADKVSIELAWLKNQVSPHFFFNTLNNIHSLIESKPEFAQKSVHMLSKLMRYLLYESNALLLPLTKEVDFIENYIGLMKLKLKDEVIVSFDYPVIPENISLPPLLFNPLIENAFKFGVSYQEESFIKIEIKIEIENVVLKVENSINKAEVLQEHAGIGLANLRKRLELLFKTNYSLLVDERPETYEVELKIPKEQTN
jgi:two-component system, LytTR family, sensor kinase